MTYSPALLVHIGAGIIGVLSGSTALVVRKGGRLHRASGDVFVVSMLSMAASGAYMALTLSQRVNVIAGVFTCYLVATAWLTVKRKQNETGLAELGLLLVALAVGIGGLILGWDAANRVTGRNGGAAAGCIIFGSLALLAASGDVRMLLRGGVSGAQRLARHLWRMGFALFIATASFFLGTASDPVLRQTGLRARLFSEAIRRTHLPEVPVILVVVLTIFWLFRVRFANAFPGPKEKKMRAPVNVIKKSLPTLLPTILICLLATAAVAWAEENPLSAHNKHVYAGLKKVLLRSAEIVPEENYSFRPTDAVRTYGQIIGHVADAQYGFCSAVLGETNPAPKIEQTKSSKADLIAALKDAFAYCDKAYDGMTDAAAAQRVKSMGSDAPKLSVLAINNMHSAEHYGNLVTYMRLKNIVPPTSDTAFMQQMKK